MGKPHTHAEEKQAPRSTQTRKRRDREPQPKRARLSETTLQQPTPKPPERASFPEDPIAPTDAISEWLESVVTDRERRCRSDSYLHASDDSPIPRKLTRSASRMADTRDAKGYAGSFAPLITLSDNTSATPGSGRSSRALVEDPCYRSQNLAANHAHMRHRYEPFPEHVASVVDYARKKRDSPGPSPDDVYRDMVWTNLR
ncbi:hypothetical protein OQA88_4473 [Cercophora sp. LCS_1]